MKIQDRIKFYEGKVKSLKGRLAEKSFRTKRSKAYLEGELEELERSIMLRERLKMQRGQEVKDG